MDYNKEPDQPTQISKYNDAVFSIMRLNDSWRECEHYANSGQLKKWKFKLDTIWRELIIDVGKIAKSKPKDAKKLIENNLILIKKIANSQSPTELYFNLNTRHEFLRKLQDLSGKAGVYVDEDEEISE